LAFQDYDPIRTQQILAPSNQHMPSQNIQYPPLTRITPFEQLAFQDYDPIRTQQILAPSNQHMPFHNPPSLTPITRFEQLPFQDYDQQIPALANYQMVSLNIPKVPITPITQNYTYKKPLSKFRVASAPPPATQSAGIPIQSSTPQVPLTLTPATGKRLQEDSSERNAKRSKTNFSIEGTRHQTDKSMDDFLNQALQRNNYEQTGVVYRSIPVDSPNADTKEVGCLVINDTKFYRFVLSTKPEGYRIQQASLMEKLDKSRPCNRVNPDDKEGTVPIKYLRVDRNSLYQSIPSVMSVTTYLKKSYEINGNSVRILTHRDWNLLPPEYFVYEIPTKKNY